MFKVKMENPNKTKQENVKKEENILKKQKDKLKNSEN